jgi:hypothetical protein
VIIFAGDSWGVGGWSDKSIGEGMIAGPSVINYINLNNNGWDGGTFDIAATITLCHGGSSNSYQLKSMSRFLEKFRLDQQDKFYWIVTDPVRCLTDQQLVESNNLTVAINHSLETFLSAANQLAKQHGVTFDMIGGLCDLDTVNIAQWTNLNVVVPSWGKLIDSDYPTSIYSNGRLYCLGESLKQNNPDLLEEWMTITDLAIRKHDRLASLADYFLQDHPTALAHRALRDCLFPEFKNLY